MDLKVNYATLSTASTDLSDGANGIQSTLDSMDADGEAQQAYLTAKQQWTEGMDDMRQVLLQISQLVDQANQSYSSTDQANAARFQ